MVHEDSQANWTERWIVGKFFQLLQADRFSVDGLTTHVFSPEACEDAFGLLQQRDAYSMGVSFAWPS